MAKEIFPALFAARESAKTDDTWEQLDEFRVRNVATLSDHIGFYGSNVASGYSVSFVTSISSGITVASSVGWSGGTSWAGGNREWNVGANILSKTMIAGEFAAVVYDHNRRPHSVNGVPAVKYSDGAEDYYWHGVKVPEFVARRPEEITTAHIEAEDNAEIRRVMIERYGLARFMADCGAVRIHKDECGELYKKNMGQGEEPMVFVKVKNSTPEPDGSIKDYFLRVPPRTKKARDGIAWTFNIPADQYKPELQT